MFDELRNLDPDLCYPPVDDDLLGIANAIYWADHDDGRGFAIALQHIRDGRIDWLVELATGSVAQ